MQMLLTSIKVLVTHMEAAFRSQYGLLKMHKSAFVANIRGRLGKNPIQVRDEQVTLLSSGEHVSEKSASSATAKPESRHFLLLLSAREDTRRTVVSKKEML